MSSELKVDTLLEKTTDNGLAIGNHKFIDNIFTQSTDVGTATISSSENGMLIGPTNITGTLTVPGKLRIL